MKSRLLLIAVSALLCACSSPFASDEDSFSIAQGHAMIQQQENQARASPMMAGQPRQPMRLIPIAPLQPFGK